MTDFFDRQDEEGQVPEEEPTEEKEPEASAKIKVGEEEFEPEELSSLVKLGKIGREAEEKYQTKIDRVWPEYTKTRQELKEIREKAEAESRSKIETKVQSGGELTPEEQREQASALLKEMGFVHKNDFVNEYTRIREGERLLDECKDLEDEINGKDGRPAFKRDEILAHMQETGIRNPEKAYKDRFEKQLDAWKEEQLKKAKPKGLVTESSSSAGGSKEPSVKVPTNEEDLEKALRESLYGSE